MDRHEVPGITAEQVAQAHALDVAVSAKRNVEFLTYWFDAGVGAAFCLARAPDAETLRDVHRESHGLVPNEIILVDEANVLRFLGRIEEPSDAERLESPFRVVLFSDLEGSTRLLNELGQAAYMVLLTEHDLIIRRALVASRGREVKHTGDGFMTAFDEVSRSLSCAASIQTAFAERNAASADGPAMRVRIGIAAGEPVDRDNDLFGSTVHLASRICAVAQGGQTLVSELVRELGTEVGFSFQDAGEHALKGFPDLTPLFAPRPG
jgi:class 3 adenylate cyclase